MLFRKVVLPSHPGPSSGAYSYIFQIFLLAILSFQKTVLLMLSHRRKVHFHPQTQCLMDYCDIETNKPKATWILKSRVAENEEYMLNLQEMSLVWGS